MEEDFYNELFRYVGKENPVAIYHNGEKCAYGIPRWLTESIVGIELIEPKKISVKRTRIIKLKNINYIERIEEGT